MGDWPFSAGQSPDQSEPNCGLCLTGCTAQDMPSLGCCRPKDEDRNGIERIDQDVRFAPQPTAGHIVRNGGYGPILGEQWAGAGRFPLEDSTLAISICPFLRGTLFVHAAALHAP